MTQETSVHPGRLEHSQEKTYIYVPFEVPAGATRLEVSYEYDHPIGAEPDVTGGNTLDVGIFDSRGIEFLGNGFRGWSGSARNSFFIAETDATPGYIAGALPEGRWHVVLGAYKVAPAGCKYRITAVVSAGAGGSRLSEPAAPPLEALGVPSAAWTDRWLCGELHCHSWHSDGDSSPADVVALAREGGLDFVAITDHNTTTGLRNLESLPEAGIVLIPGVECTTYAGHFNVWGIDGFVDFRASNADEMRRSIEKAAASGGLTSCNHPFPSGPDWAHPDVTNFHCMEVWNGPWHTGNEIALERWLARLATGARIPGIGGSDFHFARKLTTRPRRAPGTPTVWVHVSGSPSAETILDGVRRGRVTLSDAPAGPFLDIRAGTGLGAMVGDTLHVPGYWLLPIRVAWQRGSGTLLRVLDQRGSVLQRAIVEPEGTVDVEIPVAGSLYIRAELRDSGTPRALTNPIYLDQQGGGSPGR